jgi:hypothetical protein
MTEPMSPSVCRNASPRGSSRHTAIASSVNQTVRLPRRRGARRMPGGS